MNTPRSYGLDCLRAIAIILVVFVHSMPSMPPDLRVSMAYFDLAGCIGVDLFFVLSGFLMGKQIYQKNGVNTLGGLMNFSIKRFFRTYPLYLSFLLINFFLFVDSDPVTLIPYLTFTQIWMPADSGKWFYYGESWTLSIEEWFYFSISFFPFMLGLFGANYRLCVGIIVCLLCLNSNVVRWLEINESLVDLDLVRCSTSFRMDSLCYGFLVSMIPARMFKCFAKKELATVFFILAISMYILMRSPENHLTKWAFFTLPQVCLAFILPNFSGIKAPKKRVMFYVVSWTARISFSLYLVNLIPWRLNWFNGWEYGYFTVLITYLIICYLLSSISFFLIEIPFMKIRSYLLETIK